jgi:hypothetical protein
MAKSMVTARPNTLPFEKAVPATHPGGSYFDIRPRTPSPQPPADNLHQPVVSPARF